LPLTNSHGRHTTVAPERALVGDAHGRTPLSTSPGNLFAFPFSEVGLPCVFFEAAFRPLGHGRHCPQKKIIPRLISGWPHDLNPSSQKLQKHKIIKNFPNPFGTKRKVVGKGRFSLLDFLPEV
jgi:hypothetical protein